MSDTRTSDVAETNKRVVMDHFEGSINRRDPDAIARTVALDRYVGHDGPEGADGSVEDAMQRMAAMFERFPDFHVDLLDVVADGDLVIVRGIWSGTDAETATRIAFRAFVQYRLAAGRIVERWATSTTPAPVEAGDVD